MTKSGLIEEVAKRTPHISKKDTEVVVNTIFDAMIEAPTPIGDRILIFDTMTQGTTGLPSEEQLPADLIRTGGPNCLWRSPFDLQNACAQFTEPESNPALRPQDTRQKSIIDRGPEVIK